jgi:hypothetical protein
MATSPIYNWPEPDNTDLVKNGALAIRTLGDAIDTTMATMVPKTIIDAKGDIIAGTAADTAARLAVGTNGQVLKANSATATGLEWASDSAGMTNPMTTTGDTIYSSSGSTPARLGIGSTGQVLTVASGVPSWATPAGSSSGPAFSAYRSANTTISTNTWVKLAWNTENFDTNSCYDAATNFRFTPTTAGIYQVNLTVSTNGNSQGSIYKNGSDYLRILSGTSGLYFSGSTLISMNGTTDYIESYVYSSGATFYGTSTEGGFSATWIRSN